MTLYVVVQICDSPYLTTGNYIPYQLIKAFYHKDEAETACENLQQIANMSKSDYGWEICDKDLLSYFYTVEEVQIYSFP